MGEWILFGISALLLVTGLFLMLSAVIGQYRFQYVLNRMHAAAIVDTLGISLCMAGFAVSAPDLFSGLKILLVIVFWWLSSPVASHLLCRLDRQVQRRVGLLRKSFKTIHRSFLRFCYAGL